MTGNAVPGSTAHNGEHVKKLPGAPWSEAYILELLTRGGYDKVIANGWEYTRSRKRRTPEALALLSRKM